MKFKPTVKAGRPYRPAKAHPVVPQRLPSRVSKVTGVDGKNRYYLMVGGVGYQIPYNDYRRLAKSL